MSVASSVVGARRTVGGVVIPPGAVGRFAGTLAQFPPGCLAWALRTVWLDLEHQPGDLVGKPKSLAWTDDGLVGEWTTLATPTAARALQDIDDGRRVGLSLDADMLEATYDEASGVLTVTGGRLVRVSLVTQPAFDQALATISEEAA